MPPTPSPEPSSEPSSGPASAPQPSAEPEPEPSSGAGPEPSSGAGPAAAEAAEASFELARRPASEPASARNLGPVPAHGRAGGPNGSTAAQPPAPPLEIAVFSGPESAFFTTSTLIMGARDAVLVDAQPTRSAGRELAEWIAGKGRNLVAVLITHPHPDHYFGVEEVLRLFPQAHVLAAPPVVGEIASNGVRHRAELRPIFGDDVPEHPLVPRPLRPLPLMIDHQLIRVLLLGQADCAHSTVVHVPGSRTVIAGDFAFNGTHLRTAETTTEQRAAWQANLDRIAGLGAEWVVAGHRAPEQDDDADRVLDFTRGYLRDFDRLLAHHPDDPEALITAMGERYGRLTLPLFLTEGAQANTVTPG
ncbi:glyoxylase-like metal-dependent hydrolase (beta-lactamase superfamily II) [Kitasatospora acidiphila]